MEMLTYLLKVSGCMAAFYLVYYVAFRKLTFFTLNRWYLLGAMAISLLIPLLHIGVQTLIPAPDVTPIQIDTATKTILDTEIDPHIQTAHAAINWWQMAAYAYWVITAILLLRFMITFCRILYTGMVNGVKQQGYYLVNSPVHNNSSFFNYIFLKDDGLDSHEKEQVIAHELVHVKQLHSLDNLFAGLLKSILWFNPFAYLFARALSQSHEFAVDSYLATRYNVKNYAGLLLKLSSPQRLMHVNQFSAYGLKSRVSMLFAAPSATIKKLSYLLIVPVISALVYLLAVEKVYAYEPTDSKFTVVLDAGHGGKTGANFNGIREEDINLSMVKQIKTIAEQRGIKIILSRTDNTNIPLADRIKPQCDVFVSVHVNLATGKSAESQTGMVVLTDRTANRERSQKLAETMIREMQKLNGISISDEVYHQGVKVLRDNKAPAILVELGYLNNKSDLKYITDKQNQQAIAEKFVDAIVEYKKSAPAKLSGGVVSPLKTRYSMSINTPQVASKVTSKKSTIFHADTGIWETKQAQPVDTSKKLKGRMTMMKVSYTSDTDDPKSGNLYQEFKTAKTTAKDSSKYDNVTKMLYLYKGTVTSGRLNITADVIKMSLKDSIVFANGHVNLRVTGPKKIEKDNVFDLEQLTIDLKVQPKKN